ncbi:MAG: S9 family peptidase [Pseudomonadales bacterium]
MTSVQPPIATRIPQRRAFHGVDVDDPYAWLKDPDYPEVNDAEVLAYLQQENAYFQAQMAPLAPLVDELFEEIKARRPAADESVPWLENGYWYQWRYLEGAQYRTWYWAPASDPTAFTILLDEQALARGHEYFRLGGLEVSPDHRLLAYSTDTNGAERYQLQVIDLETATAVLEPIPETSGAPVFSADSAYVFYRVVNADWRPYRVMRRALREKEPEVIYEEPDPAFFVDLSVTQSDSYLILSSADHITSELHLVPRSDPLAPPRLVTARRSGHEYEVEHRDDELIIRSNKDHQNFALYRTAVEQPGEQFWREDIPGSDDVYLTGYAVYKKLTVLTQRIAGLDQIRLLPLAGEAHTVKFPEASYAVGLGTNAEFDIDQLRLGYESMVTPETVYDYDLAKRQLIVRKVQEIPSGYRSEMYRTERLQIQVRDGVEVPVSLVYHKDFPPTASRPLYQYGYGAYGIAIEPGFSTSRLSLLDRGVSYAIAHVRGGDDLGYSWYEDGKLNKRTNTFNDFADVARALIAKGYTGAGLIALAGGSAGGELVGATLNQTRDILGAAVLDVPFVDVLNTMLDTSLPLTPLEWPEWGNPVEDAEAFELIRSYSPYDQLVAGAYPPMFVTGGLNDPRVTYWEPAKYVAKLRTLKNDNNPLVLKINMGAGHGGQSGRFNAIREQAEEFAFVLTNLGATNAATDR